MTETDTITTPDNPLNVNDRYTGISERYTNTAEKRGFLSTEQQVALLSLLIVVARHYEELARANEEAALENMSAEDRIKARMEKIRALRESLYGPSPFDAHGNFIRQEPRFTYSHDTDTMTENEETPPKTTYSDYSDDSSTKQKPRFQYEAPKTAEQAPPRESKFYVYPASADPSAAESAGARLATDMFTDALRDAGWDGSSQVTKSQEAKAFRAVSSKLHTDAAERTPAQEEAFKLVTGQRSSWQGKLRDDVNETARHPSPPPQPEQTAPTEAPEPKTETAASEPAPTAPPQAEPTTLPLAIEPAPSAEPTKNEEAAQAENAQTATPTDTAPADTPGGDAPTA